MSIDLMPVPRQQFFDANGKPLAGGKVYFYTSGTNNALATYTDASGTILNSNPVILDSAGRATVWLGAGPYRVKLADANDVQLWVVDGVTSSIFGPTTTDSLQNKNLLGPNNNNSINLLNLQTNLAAFTGTGSDQTLAAYTLPANTLRTSAGIRITVGINHLSGSATAGLTFKLGNTAISSAGFSSTGQGSCQLRLFNTGNGTTFKFDDGWRFSSGFLSSVTAAASLPADFTQNQVVSLTGNYPGTDQWNVTFWMVELIQ